MFDAEGTRDKTLRKPHRTIEETAYANNYE